MSSPHDILLLIYKHTYQFENIKDGKYKTLINIAV